MPISRHRPKKGKRPIERNNNTKDNTDLLTKAFSVIIIFVIIAIMAIISSATNNVLFFPSEFYFYAGLPVFLLILFLDWNGVVYDFKEMISLKDIISLPIRVFLYLIASLIGAYCFVVPCNFYIKEASKSNPIETYRCNIESILIKYRRRRSDSFKAYYNFKNEALSYNILSETAEKLKANDNYKRYYVHLEVRKGPFETYVIQKEELRLKPIH
jgi:uncharacterized integral membrane protein